MNVFRKSAIFLSPTNSLYNSRLTNPTTAAVVVTMAGIILPAINLESNLETGLIPYPTARKF